LRKNLKFYIRAIVLVAAVSGLFVLQSCENNPNDVGLEFIISDTLGTKVLDSNKDTLLITHNNFKLFVNTFQAANFFIGKSGDYESKTILKFSGLSTDYKDATVYSATLKLHYNKYAFTDTLGTVSFNMYPLNKYYYYPTVTLDTFSSGSIGTTLIGSYTGAPTDTSTISIPLDAQTVKNWLEYEADTNYAQKNYGMALVPNSNSNTIKAFSKSDSYLCPKLVIIVNKNNKTDTLVYDSPGYVSAVTFTDAPYSILPPDRITLQNGLIYGDIMNFDLSKLSEKVTINEAYLRLKWDKANSFTGRTNPNIFFLMTTDSAAKTNDGIIRSPIQDDSITFSFRLNQIFQTWNYDKTKNLGIQLRNISDFTNLDKLVFYGPSVQDTSKRPKLIIRYTPRG